MMTALCVGLMQIRYFLSVCNMCIFCCVQETCPDLVFIGQVFAYKCQRIIYLLVNNSKMLRDLPVYALSGQNFVDFLFFLCPYFM